MGQAQAMQNHSGDSFAWRHHFLLIWHETSVNHGHQPSVLHHRSDQASMIETLDANLFHLATLPCSSLMQSSRQRRVNDFFSLSTCSMSGLGLQVGFMTGTRSSVASGPETMIRRRAGSPQKIRSDSEVRMPIFMPMPFVIPSISSILMGKASWPTPSFGLEALRSPMDRYRWEISSQEVSL